MALEIHCFQVFVGLCYQRLLTLHNAVGLLPALCHPVIDADLYAAHQKFVAADDVRHKARFKEAISEGGDAWAK
jgi:hypothetical protein